MKRKFFIKSSRVFSAIVALLFAVSESRAGYYGRFISGAFFSKEIFRAEQVNRFNDVAVFSERLYVNFDQVVSDSTEMTFDLRDKHNLFEKMNRERLKLEPNNSLQLYELNFHKVAKEEGLDFSLGRFPMSSAGGIFLDGLDLGIKKNIFGWSTRYSLFYGLNPQLAEDLKIDINERLKAYGGYFILENKGKDWGNYLYSSSSLVRQLYKQEVDRFYFFNNINFQSSDVHTFSSILYLDLEPKVYVQNFWTTYLMKLKNNYKVRASLSVIDSLHYTRVQDIRETLPSSRYQQASFSLRSPSAYGQTSYETKLTAGMREIDKKNLVEVKWGAFFPRIFKDEMSGTLNLGLKKNFISNDALAGVGLLHSNKFREISFSQDFQFEKRKMEKLNIAYITEAGYTKFFTKKLFGTMTMQNTWDDHVSIFSVLLKLSYRFGGGGQAPVRDGSPPMGQL